MSSSAISSQAEPPVTAVALANQLPCWYADVTRAPWMSWCPAQCHGPTTHAERLAGGEQHFYCDTHARWRRSRRPIDIVRRLRSDESAP
jgi:hypothetical protein